MHFVTNSGLLSAPDKYGLIVSGGASLSFSRHNPHYVDVTIPNPVTPLNWDQHGHIIASRVERGSSLALEFSGMGHEAFAVGLCVEDIAARVQPSKLFVVCPPAVLEYLPTRPSSVAFKYATSRQRLPVFFGF